MNNFMPKKTNHAIFTRAQELFDELVTIRRHLHTIPELGNKELKTSDYIARLLESWSISFERGIGGTGIAINLNHDTKRKTVALRADMDALPILEQTGLPFTSEHEGCMHACGHDMHMTCLLGALRILKEREETLPVNIKAIFQPAEELVPGGAPAVINDGFLEDPKVNSIFGLHVEPYLETGNIAVTPGAMMALTAAFTIHIKGKGGHAASSYNCIDPIPIAAQIITALQTIPSRMIDPLTPVVVSVTKMNAGTAMNIIPESAVLEGTVRSFDKETKVVLPKKMEKIIRGITSASGSGYTFEYNVGTDVLVNDEQMTEHVRTIGRTLFGDVSVHDYVPTFGGEDFADYLNEVPGCFFRLGCFSGSGNQVPLHNPAFSPDEQALVYGAAILAGIAAEYNIIDPGRILKSAQ